MYSIKKVSELLNIPTATIRAWENRYHIIKPIRSTGGHRLYRDDDVETLKWIKHRIHRYQLKVSEAVLQYQSIQSCGNPGMAGEARLRTRYDDLIEQLFNRLVDLNTMQAHETIDLAFSLFHHEEVFHHILTPVMIRVGDEWSDGSLSVAQEHFASQLIIQRCCQFLRVLPLNPALPKALAFCPEGEHHHMGLMLFSLFLRNKGHDVVYLGPDTPLRDINPLIRLKEIQIAAVSITDPARIEAVDAWIADGLKEYPDLHIVVGGSGSEQVGQPIGSHVRSLDQSDWEDWYKSAFGSQA